MKLVALHVKNYRSIVDTGEVRIESLQAFVGENNAGKSNLLRALELFLTASGGGVTLQDFHDPTQPISVTATFGALTPIERRPPLRRYLLGDKLILEKTISLVQDRKNPEKY